MARPQAKKEFSVLVAEDDKFISQAFHDGLTMAGFKVLVARDGEQAIEQINNQKPSLVLLDILMPKKDGFEVLKFIKKNKEVAKTPVIILSNVDTNEALSKAKILGANRFLLKANFSMHDVITTINTFKKE